MKDKHPFLYIPGPTNVRKDVLEAQTEAMIGHRSAEFETLFAECEVQYPKRFIELFCLSILLDNFF